MSVVHFKIPCLAVPPIGRFINYSDQLALSFLMAEAVGFLVDTCGHVVEVREEGGAYSLCGSRYIYIKGVPRVR
jgi:hypothetical protein